MKWKKAKWELLSSAHTKKWYDICQRLRRQLAAFFSFAIIIFLHVFHFSLLLRLYHSYVAFYELDKYGKHIQFYLVQHPHKTHTTTTTKCVEPTSAMLANKRGERHEWQRWKKCSLNSFLPYAIKIAFKSHVFDEAIYEYKIRTVHCENELNENGTWTKRKNWATRIKTIFVVVTYIHWPYEIVPVMRWRRTGEEKNVENYWKKLTELVRKSNHQTIFNDTVL